MATRKDKLITSTLTFGDLVTKPLELGQKDTATRHGRFLNSPGVQRISFDCDAARIFAQIRTDRTIIITNDARLSQKTVPGVDFIVPLDRVFL